MTQPPVTPSSEPTRLPSALEFILAFGLSGLFTTAMFVALTVPRDNYTAHAVERLAYHEYGVVLTDENVDDLLPGEREQAPRQVVGFNLIPFPEVVDSVPEEFGSADVQLPTGEEVDAQLEWDGSSWILVDGDSGAELEHVQSES